jgi:N-methylhydantoinase A
LLGENYELMVPAGDGTVAQLRERFGQEHERTYGYWSDTETVEIVNARVVAHGLSSAARVPERLAPRRRAGVARASSRRAFFGATLGWIDVAIGARDDLRAREVAGPLLIEEYDSTLVLPPGCRATLDAWDNVVVTVGGSARGGKR